jgi:hypothetical protein
MGVGGMELPEHRNPAQGGVEGSLIGKFRQEPSDNAPLETNRSRCAVMNRAASAFILTECEHPACADEVETHPEDASRSVAMSQPRARCPGTCDFAQIVSENLDWCIRLQTRVGRRSASASGSCDATNLPLNGHNRKCYVRARKKPASKRTRPDCEGTFP